MKVITANRLLNGDVVWLAENGSWVERITLAKVYDGKEAVAAALAEGLEAEKNQKVVGVYEMDVTVEEGVIVPVRLRERSGQPARPPTRNWASRPRRFPPETTMKGRAAPSMAAPAEERLRHVPLRRI